MANRPINVVIKGDYSDKDVKRAINDLHSLQRQGPKTSQALRTVGKGFAIMGAAAGVAAIAIGVDAVQAAAEDEKRVAKLTQVLTNFNKEAEAPGVLAGIDAMQRQYGVAEDLLTPAFLRLMSATGDTAQSFDLLQLSLDLSAASGKSLDMAAKSLGRAIEGSTGGLSKMGVGLSAADIKAAGLEGTIGILEERFGGTALAAVDTMSGGMDRLKIAVGEVQESLGAGIMEGFTGPDIEAAMTNLKEAEDDVNRIGVALGNLGSNSIGWTADFLTGLEAISFGVDIWALDVTSKINGVLDVMNIISDEEGQRRSDNEIALRAQTTQEFINSQLAPATPTQMATPNGQRTNTDGSVTNIYQFGDIQVESSSALTEVQKQAARLASVGGARYAGMAATGDGYRRRKRKGNR